MQTGIMRADLAFQSDRLLVSVVIQPQTRPFEPVADAGADFWRVFSDPSGENNRVRTPHACEECSNVFSCAIAKDLDCKAHPAVVMLRLFLQQYAHVVGQPGDAEQSGLGVSSASVSPAHRPSLVAIRLTIAGSMSPDRVPITKPSSGVIPIDVSMELPPRIAAAEHPFPRCK